MKRPVFSGHETFKCKTHWLKRGYDFICEGGNFNDEDSVVRLGVGKNMVSSIKYWMKAFGFIDEDNRITEIAEYLLNEGSGADPYFEDMGTLWLLHFMLIDNAHATIYEKTFVDYHRGRTEIDKSKLHNNIKTNCFDGIYSKQYNESTINKDINVLIHNYCSATKESVEEKNTLLLPLNLIIQGSEKDVWLFNSLHCKNIPVDIFLYAIVSRGNNSNSIPFELLQDLALIFCIDNNELVEMINKICAQYSTDIVFSDNAGIKELQFKRKFEKFEILSTYYGH